MAGAWVPGAQGGEVEVRFRVVRVGVDVDASIIRPDGCVARALPTGQGPGATTLVRAPGTWSGRPA